MSKDHGEEVPGLGWFGAIVCAVTNRPVDHFPRRVGDQGVEGIKSTQILQEIEAELENLVKGEDAEALANLVARGRETLNEVKALTEYEDQKAARLLTIVTVFTALAGVLFNAFSSAHPVQFWGGASAWSQFFVVIVYGLFGLFVVSVVCGALVIFHANKVRFRYPSRTNTNPGSKPKSYLFFVSIVGVNPADWASSFVQARGARTVPRNGLSLQYAKNYIAESYLVAAKVADKMRYLEPAQAILGFALRVLLAWLVAAAAVSIFQPAKEKDVRPAPIDLSVRIEWPKGHANGDGAASEAGIAPKPVAEAKAAYASGEANAKVK